MDKQSHEIIPCTEQGSREFMNLLQVSALLSNSAAACLELQQFEEALLYSSTAAMMQVADEGLLSKADGSDVWGVLR